MPIRINLLAESQAVEEIRRRDPVKRAIWAGVCLVVLVLVWSSSLQVKIMAENGKLGNLEGSLNSKTNDYTKILDNEKKLVEINAKLEALNKMAAGRFLQANWMDAFLHSAADNIQINHLRTEQSFEVVPEVPASRSESGKMIPGKPGSSAERIKLYLDASDNSTTPGIQQVNRFKGTIAKTPYFEQEKIGTNGITLKSISSSQFNTDTQKAFVLFSMEIMYPEHAH